MATLSERLAEKAKRNPNVKGQGRAAFIALKPDIKSALDEGWSAKEIWTLLREEEKISISYSVFLRYIRAYGLKEVSKSEEPIGQLPAGSEVISPPVAAPAEVKPGEKFAGSSTFKLNSEPDKENLV